jgi:cytochrome c
MRPLLVLVSVLMFSSVTTAYAAPDLANGAKQFNKCKSCHTIVKGGKNLIGPNLNGLFGRKSGSVTGYNYSPAMKAAGVTWNDAKLDVYLTDPKAMVKGTRMSFAGIKNAKDRTDLIAYLKANTK